MALVIRELREAALNGVGVERGKHVPREVIGHDRNQLWLEREVAGGAPAARTGEIDGLVVDDGEQVGGEATARPIEAVGLPPKGEERFLDRVFGRWSFTQDAIGQPEGATADAIVERAHGRRIAPLGSVEQRIGID